MDKYEFNIKVEQIKKLVNKGDYETAMKIADTIDWRRVRSTSLLTMVAQVYERNEEYQDAKDILLLAFERAPIGKGLLFKLTDLALREGSVSEAEAYYREFCDLSSDDPRQYVLRYLILEAKGAPVEQLINSLERFSQEELDEKWLYRLAELYHESGNPDACVRMCDKIMLMFGLGKYVDKAMELKLQYAPLTEYQMDLVENREKYEEKLRAVEQKSSGSVRQMDAGPEEEAGYDDNIRAGDDSDIAEEQEDREPSEYAGMYGEAAPEAGQENLEENLILKMHEEEVEKNLAREMAGIEPYNEESVPEEETRILNDIRNIKLSTSEYSMEQSAATSVEQFESEEETVVEDWDLEPAVESRNHLMIEADDPQRGLDLALESLKKLHREMGTKNSVAKISGENLNKKGIFAVADRLAGKDLIIERAAELNIMTITELNELMEQDTTDMIVVLIDTPIRMERLHNNNSGLADKFQYIGCDREEPFDEPDEIEEEEESEEDREYESGNDRNYDRDRQEEILRLQAERADEAERRRLEEREAAERLESQNAIRAAQERQQRMEAEEERQRAEYEAAASQDPQPSPIQQQPSSYIPPEHDADAMAGVPEYEEDRDYPADYEAVEDEKVDIPENREPVTPDGSHEMDVEEFAQYACRYAAEIDCSISGKSMLALYERAEMMEEDGVSLNKESAEELLEEAADKAEKRSFGGLFSPKYDKDGLLILKEKHFFD